MKKDYKRWTERAKDGSPALITERIFYEIKKSQGEGKKHYFADNGDVLDIVTRYLADLEDKMEQGLMIELPCKVGDTVYTVEYANFYARWFIEEHKIAEMLIGKDDIYFMNEHGCCVYNAFLTREEAEARLAELKGEKQ